MTVDPIVASLLVEAMAVQTRVEGMKAENAACALHGQELDYREAHFQAEAASLGHIAEALRQRQ